MRERLPDRRRAVSAELQHNGFACTLSAGMYDDGRIGEVFVGGLKNGSGIEALVSDAAVLVSFLLQEGIAAADLAKHLGRLEGKAPASLIGAVVDHLVEISRYDDGKQA